MKIVIFLLLCFIIGFPLYLITIFIPLIAKCIIIGGIVIFIGWLCKRITL